MSKMVDSNKLARLAAELDRRMKVEVQTEQERARIAEDAIQQNVDAVEEMLGGKSLRYVTQEEHDMLSEDEKNDPNIVWNITDAPEYYQTIKDENLNTEDKTIVGAINELNENNINNNKIKTNALDLGIQASPTFDCTSILQAEIDRLYALGGGVIEFPVGEYYFKGSVILRPRVQIQGVGETRFWLHTTTGTVFHHIPDSSMDFFVIDDNNKISDYVIELIVKNIHVKGSSLSNIGFNLTGVAYANIENLLVEGFNCDFRLDALMTSVFRNINLQNARTDLLKITNDFTVSTTTNFYDCYFGQSYVTDCKPLNIAKGSCLDVSFNNCVFESTSEGLFIGSGNIVNFVNIYVENVPALTIPTVNPTNPTINIGIDDGTEKFKGDIHFNGGIIAGGNITPVDGSVLINVDNVVNLSFNNVHLARARELIRRTNNSKKITFIGCNEVQITEGLFSGSVRQYLDIIGCYSTAYGNEAKNNLQSFKMKNYNVDAEYYRTDSDLIFRVGDEPIEKSTMILDNNKNVQLFGANSNYNSITGGGSLIINPTDPKVAGTLNSALLYSKAVDNEIVLHEFTSNNVNQPILTSRYGTTENRPISGRHEGLIYFDTTINRPIWWNGSKWVDIIEEENNNLNTEDKTIVGAINELNELIPCRDTRDTTVEFTFDGNSDGKVTIASGEDLQYYIKISDDIDSIQIDSIEVGKVKYVMTYNDGRIEEIEAEYIESCEGHDGEIGAIMIDNHDIYIVLKDNFEALILFKEVTFPEKGIYVVAKDGYIKYHVSSVSLPGSTIKQLDEKFIPDTIARIDDVEEFVNDAINNMPEGFSGNYEDLTNKPNIPTKTSQLTNDSGFITGIPSEYVTSSELQQTLQPYDQELSEIYDWVETDFAKKEENLVNKSIAENVLTLTTDKRQKVEMVDETEIVLPTVEDFTEIHLYFSTLTDLTLIFPAGKYQKTPEIKANKTYEFIFTYVGEWLIGYIEYGN